MQEERRPTKRDVDVLIDCTMLAGVEQHHLTKRPVGVQLSSAPLRDAWHGGAASRREIIPGATRSEQVNMHACMQQPTDI